MSPAARIKPIEAEPPTLELIVRSYPNPLDVIRAYVESDFAIRLATEHERKVSLLADETAEVTDAASMRRVGELLVEVVGHKKDVTSWFEPIAALADRFHKAITGRRVQVLAPLVAFEAKAKTNVDRFQREQDRLRREEEQRLAEDGRREEQRRLEAEAALLENRGEPELASQVLEQAIATQAPVVVLPSRTPEVRGVSFSANYKWRPVGGDTPEGRARAVKLVPREFLCLDDKKLNAHAKAHGLSGRLPGIEFYDAGTVRVRT